MCFLSTCAMNTVVSRKLLLFTESSTFICVISQLYTVQFGTQPCIQEHILRQGHTEEVQQHSPVGPRTHQPLLPCGTNTGTSF